MATYSRDDEVEWLTQYVGQAVWRLAEVECRLRTAGSIAPVLRERRQVANDLGCLWDALEQALAEL